MRGREIEGLMLAAVIGGGIAWILTGVIEVLWKWRNKK